MKTICCEFHDFSVLNNRLDLLTTLKEHFPNLKVTMFTIPFDYRAEGSPSGRIMRPTTLEAIKKNLDWIQIVPHGLLHLPREFEKCDYDTMKNKVMPAIDEAFKKDGLPYEKGFCAPYWLWNAEVVRALDEEGWWGAIDPRQPKMLKTKRFYGYSHSIADPFWGSDKDVLKLHGHMSEPDPNNIQRCFFNLMKMPTDAKFVYATDLLEE